MRKYRGLTKESEWVYGWYCEVEDIHYIIPDTASTFTAIISKMAAGHFVLEGLVEVIPETVGQSTGRKDKKRKDIYAGHILKHNPDDDDWNDVVQWWPEKAMFELKSYVDAYNEIERHKGEDDYCMRRIGIDSSMLRFADWVYGSDNPSLIIGDIHTTPKLLEEQP